MIVTKLVLKNWRNFSSVDVKLRRRTFLVGPNAVGKSNFLEVFRFLRDIAKSQGGGLQDAVREAGGLKKIRCLAARRNPDVEIEIELGDSPDVPPTWQYSIGLAQNTAKSAKPLLSYERVVQHSQIILDRPDNDDRNDPERLTQTHLEQTFANSAFRDVARFLEDVTYLHLVPQLVRQADKYVGPRLTNDPFGLNFMDRLAKTPKGDRTAFLERVGKALRVAVPQFKRLSYVEDEKGKPHVQVIYEHWRPGGARQQEDQFSDGTIRLLGLFWALLEGEGLLLLEEPELSLNNEIISQIPALMHKVIGQKRRQVMVSTHSYALLADRGIGLEEVLVLVPHSEGTKVVQASSKPEVKALVEEGMTVGEAVLPLTSPQESYQMTLL
jgi:predicted ATPase